MFLIPLAREPRGTLLYLQPPRGVLNNCNWTRLGSFTYSVVSRAAHFTIHFVHLPFKEWKKWKKGAWPPRSKSAAPLGTVGTRARPAPWKERDRKRGEDVGQHGGMHTLQGPSSQKHPAARHKFLFSCPFYLRDALIFLPLAWYPQPTTHQPASLQWAPRYRQAILGLFESLSLLSQDVLPLWQPQSPDAVPCVDEGIAPAVSGSRNLG